VIAKNQRRKLIITPFLCSHYQHHGDIRLCDHFTFPSNVECSYESFRIIAHNHSCVIKGQKDEGNTFLTKVSDYDLDGNATITQSVNYTKYDCVAGDFTFRLGKFYKIISYMNFQPKYYHLFNLTMRILNYEDNGHYNYAVIHWRRGDQMKDTSRCGGSTTKYYHCYDVHKFIDYVERVVKPLYIPADMKIYIATNEDNAVILNQLSSQGYHTMRDIIPYIGLGHQAIGIFILELMLMCKALVFLSGGFTTVKDFVDVWRLANGFHNTVTNLTNT
jgi:hypothetical protein